MNRIDTQCKKFLGKRLGLMAHTVAGYPTIARSRENLRILAEAGVDFIELQIPFSDPLGDGQTIREANAVALKGGIRVCDAFAIIKAARTKDNIKIPLLFMTYFNIVFTYGVEKFCKDAKSAGIDGLIIPDATIETEHYDHLDAIAAKHDLHLIKFAGIDTGEKRLQAIAEHERGFTYCFSRRGITGAHAGLDPIIKKRLKVVRKYFKKPLGVGFGISKPDDIDTLRKSGADIVIVGSAFVEAFKAGGAYGLRKKAKELVAAL